jgi:hypothetical protein
MERRRFSVGKELEVTGKLSADLEGTLRELREEFGLEMEEEEYSEAAFGNAFIILAGHDFAMRIVRDRGDIFCDLAKVDRRWRDADKTIESLGLHPDPNTCLTPDQILQALRNHKERILNAL